MPVENSCISLGNGARFLVRRGFAKEMTTEQLLNLIDLAQELKLTHVTDNIRNRPTFICNCCGCCCEIMAGIKKGKFNGVGKTTYIATIDMDKCNYCGKCFLACNVNAIRPVKTNGTIHRVSELNKDICLGCGACIGACPENAISLIPRNDYILPPQTKRKLFKQILIEKRRLKPFIFEIIKRKAKGINPFIK
jgi:ferredoxin